MFELACHTWAFNDLTLQEALGTIARLGFRRVDIGSGPNLNAPKAAAEPRAVAGEIKRDLEAFNLRVSDLYLLHPRISLADEEKRTKELELFRQLLPFAVELGTPGITLSPGLAHPKEDTEALDRTTAALREMVAAGKEVGLRISIEPHMDSMAQTPETALALVKDVPGLEITLDWSHMLCQDIKHDAVLPLLEHTRHVQLRQAAKGKLQTPYDKGKLDVPKVIGALKTAGYKDVVAIEYMNTPGWHGMVAVNAIREATRLRDEIKAARDAKT